MRVRSRGTTGRSPGWSAEQPGQVRWGVWLETGDGVTGMTGWVCRKAERCVGVRDLKRTRFWTCSNGNGPSSETTHQTIHSVTGPRLDHPNFGRSEYGTPRKWTPPPPNQKHVRLQSRSEKRDKVLDFAPILPGSGIYILGEVQSSEMMEDSFFSLTLTFSLAPPSLGHT